MSYPGANQSFQEQVKRLRANYGEDKFHKEKINLIWEELMEFSPKQIKSICEFVMANNNFAPTIQPFRESASMLREKLREHERQQEGENAKHFWEGTFHPEEVKATMQTIRLRLEGKISDDEWKQFQDILKTNADRNPAKCKRCDDTIIYFNSEYRPHKCHHAISPIIRKT